MAASLTLGSQTEISSWILNYPEQCVLLASCGLSQLISVLNLLVVFIR